MVDFNPRSPSGLRPGYNKDKIKNGTFQSTQPEWAATIAKLGSKQAADISIHAARVGCDIGGGFNAGNKLHISIHAARVGCDTLTRKHTHFLTIFQSTQPEWAATKLNHIETGIENISIHAARVGCDRRTRRTVISTEYFNPRSPSGLRLFAIIMPKMICIFQSTQPEWAATYVDACRGLIIYISIHAARVGCDQKQV